MYVRPNFMTKKDLEEAVAVGKTVTLYALGSKFGVCTQKEGVITIEGPYFEDPVTGKPCKLLPKPQSWAAQVTVRDGKVVKVI